MIIQLISPEETYDLRHLVLWPHLHSRDVCTIDIDHRSDALHYGVRVNETIVAIGSFFKMESPKITALNPYRLRAMAVHPQYRGHDYGQFLIRKACEAVSFHSRLGFTALAEVYDVPPIGPHQFMWKAL
jgi:GNAT superfamily N-acetyltransferase